MNISIFAIILIAVILIEFIKHGLSEKYFEIILGITIACSLNVRMGYFIKIGENAISYGSVLIYFTSIIAIYFIAKKGFVSKKLFNCYLVLWLILFIGVFINYINPYSEKVIIGDWTNYILGKNVYSYLDSSSLQIGYYLMFLCSGLILLSSKKILKYDNWNSILSMVLNVSKISIVLGGIEFILRNIFNSQIVTDICILIFGTEGAQQNLLFARGNLFTIQGMTKEASMYTTVIFYITILFILKAKLEKQKNYNIKLWIVACFVLELINNTLSSKVYLLILLLFIMSNKMLLGNKQIIKKYIKIFMGILIFILAIIIVISQYKIFIQSQNYILHRIGISIQQLQLIINGTRNLLYSSEAIRFSGIIYDLKMIFLRPLFGYGLGSLSCNSGIITLIVNAGIPAFIVWIISIYQFACIKKSKNLIFFLIEILILPSIMLNDYETVLSLVIPLSTLMYSYMQEKRKIR